MNDIDNKKVGYPDAYIEVSDDHDKTLHEDAGGISPEFGIFSTHIRDIDVSVVHMAKVEQFFRNTKGWNLLSCYELSDGINKFEKVSILRNKEITIIISEEYIDGMVRQYFYPETINDLNKIENELKTNKAPGK